MTIVCESVRPPPLPETGLYPFGARQHIAPAEPHRQIDHQENLIEHGPQPWNPQTFEPISKSPIHHQHGAGNIKHARCIRQPQHIKRQRLSAQKIRIHILCRLLFQKQPDGDNNHQISTNNQNINDMQFHSIRFIFYSNTCVMGRPIHTCGCSRLKTDAIVDAQSNCIMLSSKAPPFLMFFPAIMNGVSISSMVFPPCPLLIPP